MEKMSVLKPSKQPRMLNQSQVIPSVKIESLDSHTSPEEKDRSSVPHPIPKVETPALPSADLTANQTGVKTQRHAKGHKVRTLSKVWEFMDNQEFLRLTDSVSLSDVWFQPVSVVESKTLFTDVTFLEIVFGFHIKRRTVNHKMNLEDLMKMLYLNDLTQWRMRHIDCMDYDSWVSEKTAEFIKRHGVADSSNKSKLCNYIITEDKEFTFYPSGWISHVSFFFRKTCQHSYPDKTSTVKFENPSLMKCKSFRGSFDYLYEIRMIVLPDSWYDSTIPADLPATQPFEVEELI